MNTLKIAVVALLVLTGGLLYTVLRLKNRLIETETAPVAQVAAPEAPPAPAAAIPAAQEKPSPIPARRAVKPAAPPRQQSPVETPATTPPSAPVAEKPAEATPAPPPEPPKPPAPPVPPAPRSATIVAGTVLMVRTQNTLSTERNFTGDTFTATLAEPLAADDFVIAEKGAEVEGRVVRSEKGGRVEGVASLAVELVRLNTSDGQKLALATGPHEVRAQKTTRSDAKKVGVATGIGAIIGAIAGGGKGAAIGAGVGAGAGAGTVAATRGDQAAIPAESLLRFELRAPLSVVEKR